jgi:hypothetical protein
MCPYITSFQANKLIEIFNIFVLNFIRCLFQDLILSEEIALSNHSSNKIKFSNSMDNA